MIRKYILYALLFPASLMCGQQKFHVYEAHCHDPKATYVDVIENTVNGVASIVYKKKNPKWLEGQRKTLFPKQMQDKNFDNAITYCSKKGNCLFRHDQINSTTGRFVEYRQDLYNKALVFAFVKEQSGKIKTAYPMLVYISLDDLNQKDPSDLIYIGTVKDQKSNKFCDCNLTVFDIERVSHDGVYLGHRYLDGRIQYLVDISKALGTDFFYGKEEERGSIVVETTWITPRSKK